MTPDELAQRYFLARVLWWRNDLEQFDAAAVAELVKAFKAANVEMREQVRRELPDVWDAYAKEGNRERVKVWLADLVAPTAAGVVNSVTEAWTISASKASRHATIPCHYSGLPKIYRQSRCWPIRSRHSPIRPISADGCSPIGSIALLTKGPSTPLSNLLIVASPSVGATRRPLKTCWVRLLTLDLLSHSASASRLPAAIFSKPALMLHLPSLNRTKISSRA